MKKMVLLGVSIAALSILGACKYSEKTGVIPISIIQMNDVHGHVEQDRNGKNGISNAAYLIDQIRAEDEWDNTVLIANGDMLQETAISRVNYGRVVIDCLSEIGFDMMGVGNHEFDWGLDKVLSYFDGDVSNGEASFPLLNANIVTNSGTLVTVDNGNVLSSAIVEKEDVKVGMISYIGDVYSSITANMTAGYTFKSDSSQIATSVLEIGSQLKKDGADIIVVNIHGGNTSSVSSYQPNNAIAGLKYKEEYLVDAVINGHSHTHQAGMIQRTGGVAMPVIQSSGKLSEMGRIDLTYDYDSGAVTKTSTSHISVSSAGKNHNAKVEAIVEGYYDASKTLLEEVYCQNETTINSYDDNLHRWAGNLMMAATGATAAVCNTGAFRNSVSYGAFDFPSLYALNPFDNHIILCTIRGIDLKRFMDANRDYEFCYTKDYGASIATDVSYTLAVVDYVYFSNFFAGYRDGNYVDTQIIMRDLMVEELRLHNQTGFNIFNDADDILLEQLYTQVS